jgi:threonine/homoserine efflux transporter RhtA
LKPVAAKEFARSTSSLAAFEDRRMRIFAIALMCGAMVCFTGLDTSSKWLGLTLPTAQIVWARYAGAAVIALAVARPWSHPAVLRSSRPGLQALRSLLLLGATVSVVVALRQLPPDRCLASASAASGRSRSRSDSSAS